MASHWFKRVTVGLSANANTLFETLTPFQIMLTPFQLMLTPFQIMLTPLQLMLTHAGSPFVSTSSCSRYLLSS